MKEKRKNRLTGRKGFTLAELLIVVAILATTASVGFLSVSSAKKNQEARAADDTAKQIYLAAQNRLLQMKEYGEWEMVQKNHDNLNDAYYGEELNDKPSDYEFWQQVTGQGTDFAKKDMRVLRSDDSGHELLKELLLPNVLEDGVRNGHYLIEYNVKTATVYGVFYSEDSFTASDLFTGNCFYGGNINADDNGRFVGTNETKARDIRKNFSAAGGKIVLGYFGGGMVDQLSTEEVPLPEVVVYNGEELILHVENLKENSWIYFEVRGISSAISRKYTLMQTETETACFCGYALDPVGEGKYTDCLHLVKRWNSSGEGSSYRSSYDIVLDSHAAKINDCSQSSDFHFHKNFPGFYPGEDLEITVFVTSRDSISLPGVRTVKTNSLFASVSPSSLDVDGKGSGGIEINALRHLMNLNHSKSGVVFDQMDSTGLKYVFPNNGTSFLRAYLSANISFDGKGEGVLQFPDVTYCKEGITYSPINLELKDYVQKFYLSGKRNDADTGETPHRIYDLSISGCGDLGLFGTVSKNISSGVAGLELRDLGIVKAADSAAGETQITATGTASDVNIGAFVGRADCDVTLLSCYSTVLIRSDAVGTNGVNIGGLVGRVNGTLTVSSSYVSGRTVGGKYGADDDIRFHTNGSEQIDSKYTNIGGFAGSVGGAVSITGSYCVAGIGNRDNDGFHNDMVSGVYHIGGLVGETLKAKNLTVSSSYFYAPVDIPCEEELAGNASNIWLGGFIGSRSGTGTGTCSITNSSYIKEYLCRSDIGKTQNGERVTVTVCGISQDYRAETDAVLDIKLSGSEVDSYPYEFTFTDGDTNKSLIDLTGSYWDLSANAGMKSFYAVKASLDEITPIDDAATHPYDSSLAGKSYPYQDVTGLGHHYGDWAEQLMDSTLTLEYGVGVAALTDVAVTYTDENGNTVTKDWAYPKDKDGNDIEDRLCITGIPAGTGLNLSGDKDTGSCFKVSLKDGYTKLALERHNSRLDHSGTDWTYTVTGVNEKVTVHAGGIEKPVLSCPDKTEADDEFTGNGNYRRVFGYEDVPLKIELKQGTSQQAYDPGITLCFLWGEKNTEVLDYTWKVNPANLGVSSKFNDMVNVSNPKDPACDYYANLPATSRFGTSSEKGLVQFDLKTDRDLSLQDGFTVDEKNGAVSGHTVHLKKRSLYGIRQYQVRAYAYASTAAADGTVKTVNWLRTALSVPLNLSASLDRVKLSFVYDPEGTRNKNLLGNYEIIAEETVTSYTDNNNTVYEVYIEYEDPDYNNDKLGSTHQPFTIFTNNGIADGQSSSKYGDEDAPDQQKTADIPYAQFYDGTGINRTDIVFRGWQDAGNYDGGTLDCRDWDWEEFNYDPSKTCYGADLWTEDRNNDSNHTPDGTEMLVIENIPENSDHPLTPHGGVQDYASEIDGTVYFRPVKRTPIQLKARWWREKVREEGDPNGGYYPVK